MPKTTPPATYFLSTGFANESDLPAMAGLLQELFSLENDFQPDTARQLAGLSLIHQTPSLGRLFALHMNDQLIGMANLLYLISTAEGGRVGLLEDVIITQAYRGCGFGRHLLQHVCAWAQQTGLQRISLLTDRTNETALRFYHTLGFDVSGMCVLRKYF